MTIAFVFPGQGSQTIGMGREFIENFATAKEVMQEVDDVLEQKLTHLILEGVSNELTLTENAQPALLAISIAITRTLQKEVNRSIPNLCQFMAGHSLGEYSALCASGVLSLKDAVRLVRLRGQAMQQAVPVGKGAMAAVLGLEIDDVEKLIAGVNKADSTCGVANDNSPGQVVISGHCEAIDAAMKAATEQGAKRALLLPVSAPFHSPLMADAAKAMEEAFREVTFNTPQVQVFSNITAMPIKDASFIPGLLVEQITGRVRWRETVINLGHLGCTHMVEVGAGKVLTGLNKRINPDLVTLAINVPADIDEFLKVL